MKDYAKQIQQTRENGGLMSHPVSNELLNAELKLAEVSRKTIINIYGSGLIREEGTGRASALPIFESFNH